MLGRQKAGRPVHVAVRRQAARIGQHDERRQVVVHAAQAVADPRTHAGKAGQHETGRLHERGRPVHVRLRDHRMDERDVVDALAECRDRIAEPFAALAVLPPAKRRIHHLVRRRLKQLDRFARIELLAVMLRERRLVVPQDRTGSRRPTCRAARRAWPSAGTAECAVALPRPSPANSPSSPSMLASAMPPSPPPNRQRKSRRDVCNSDSSWNLDLRHRPARSIDKHKLIHIEDQPTRICQTVAIGIFDERREFRRRPARGQMQAARRRSGAPQCSSPTVRCAPQNAPPSAP